MLKSPPPINSGRGKIEMAKDYKLSRYACYLIAQNDDPRKEVIALAQTYLPSKQGNRNYLKNSIVNLLRMRKDYIEEIKQKKEIII